MFEIKNLSKQYENEFALQDITMNIGKGMNFIVGASGSGKTTLLKIISGMEESFEGSAFYCGRDIKTFSEKEKSALYNCVFGFVWQDFHLLEDATALENVLLPAYLKDSADVKRAEKLLSDLGVSQIRYQKVRELSGGQKQRVAIARELMKNPSVIFCDEPTSALDKESSENIIGILRSLSKTKTVVVVTHDTSLITEKDFVFELDKGELISSPEREAKQKKSDAELNAPKLSFKNAVKLCFSGIKNKAVRFAVSAVSLMLAGTLLLTTVSGAIGKSGESEFRRLVETYGEGILDIGLVGSFMSAAGGSEEGPNGSVDQNLDGLYEKYQNDERVEYIVSMQPFENIEITMDGKTYSVEKTGNSPVLAKLLSGSIPQGETPSVVIPKKFAEIAGLNAETAIGREINFKATVFQWIDNAPIEKPIEIKAVICGVGDNTVVYDYEGKLYNYTVDDSFFFNRTAIEEIRNQAGITDKAANFTIRAKSPEALISLKDELNRAGIVPLGRFELIEDIVRLNEQTAKQSGSMSVVIAVLALLLAAVIFAMTSVLRKREYAVYKVSGYRTSQLVKIIAAETAASAIAAVFLMIILSPLLNVLTNAMFGANILSASKLALGALLVLAVSVIAFAAALPAAVFASASSMLKAGEKA